MSLIYVSSILAADVEYLFKETWENAVRHRQALQDEIGKVAIDRVAFSMPYDKKLRDKKMIILERVEIVENLIRELADWGIDLEVANGNGGSMPR